MRAATKTIARVAVTGAALGAAAFWVNWLLRRQRHWQVALAESIPVNSAYWRARRERGGDLLYVAVGDSAAQGIGASRPGRSYVGLLARELSAAAGQRVRVVNLGISGATVGIAIDKELPRLHKLQPDVLTVSIGANDIADWDPARFDRQLRELLDALPPHAIVADLPSFYFLPGERKAQLANRLLRAACAERGLEVVELHDAMAREGLWGIATQFAGDLFHPNDRGYQVWADAFSPAVLRRLRAVLATRSAAARSRAQSSSGSAASSERSQSRASTNTESE